MKTFRLAIIPILAVCIIGVMGIVQAEDFTFTVPLRLNNLHSQVDSVRVYCQALSPSGTMVGGWNTLVPVGPTGSVFQDVQVSFNALPNQVASDASQYKCSFLLHAKGDPISILYAPNEGSSMFNKSKPGTVLVPVVSGPIPKGVSPTFSPSFLPVSPK